jgi:hypothetical protein
VNFTEHDVEALNDFQPILLPLVPQLVDNVYHHLFKFDVTKKVFMPRKEGHEGRMLADLHDLALDAPQIELRKRTFAVYMRKLVTLDYDDFATWQYFGASLRLLIPPQELISSLLDHIGIMHTGKNELKHRKLMGKTPLFVDLMHLSLLLGTLSSFSGVVCFETDVMPSSLDSRCLDSRHSLLHRIPPFETDRNHASLPKSRLDPERPFLSPLRRT